MVFGGLPDGQSESDDEVVVLGLIPGGLKLLQFADE